MKKCKNCKSSFKDYKRNGVSISKFCPVCRKQKENDKKQKHEQTKGFQESERKKLHRKAWKLMSLWVRKSRADWKDFVKCFTCPAVKNYKEMDCGHFWHDRLDFEEDNLRIQCTMCNRYLSGNLGVYAINLLHELGDTKFYALAARAKRFQGYSVEELKKIIEDLSTKLENLK